MLYLILGILLLALIVFLILWKLNKLEKISILSKVVIVIVLVVSMIGIIFVMAIDNSSFKVSIDKNIEISDSFLDSTTLDINDINEISTISKMPSYEKNNGLDTAKTLAGDFSVDGYGDCTVYVKNDLDSIIVVKEKDGSYLLFTDNTKETTQNDFNKLQNLTDSK